MPFIKTPGGSGGSPSGAAGGDLGSTYPNPTVVGITASGLVGLDFETIADGEFLKREGGYILSRPVTAAAVPQDQIFYVGKHGNDSWAGTTIDTAFLTFGAATAAATALTPNASNLISIVCLDAGIYVEEIDLPAFVSLYAPHITIAPLANGDALTVRYASTVEVGDISLTGASSGIVRTGAVPDPTTGNFTPFVKARSIFNDSTDVCYLYHNDTAGVVCYFTCGSLKVGVTSSAIRDAGSTVLEIGEIVSTTLSGYMVDITVSGKTTGHIGRMIASSLGTDVAIQIAAGGKADLVIDYVDLTGGTFTAVSVGGTLRAFVGEKVFGADSGAGGTIDVVYANSPTAKNLLETAGPTVLAMGSVTDGQFLKRSGSTITSAAVSSTPTGQASGDLNGSYPSPTVSGLHTLDNVALTFGLLHNNANLFLRRSGTEVISDVIPAASGIVTTTGPTTLTVGAIADGQSLQRSGATIIGLTDTLQTVYAGGNTIQPTLVNTPVSLQYPALVATTSGILLLQNATTATAGVPTQYSPALRFSAQTYTASSGDTQTQFQLYAQSTTSETAADASLRLEQKLGAGAYTDIVSFQRYFNNQPTTYHNNWIAASETYGVVVGTNFNTNMVQRINANLSALGLTSSSNAIYLNAINTSEFAFCHTGNLNQATNRVFTFITSNNWSTAPVHKLMSIGWENSSNVYQEQLWHVPNDGFHNNTYYRVDKTALTNSTASGLVLANDTAALVGSQTQNSPAVSWRDQAWDVTNARNVVHDWRSFAFARPDTTPLSYLKLQISTSAGAHQDAFSFKSHGLFKYEMTSAVGSTPSGVLGDTAFFTGASTGNTMAFYDGTNWIDIKTGATLTA